MNVEPDVAVERVFKRRITVVDGGETRRITVELVELADPPVDDAELVRRVLVGWEGIEGDDGAPVPFRTDTRDRLVGMDRWRSAIATAYRDAVNQP